MKQLRPRTLLGVGLPGSLLVNLCFAGLGFYMLMDETADWRTPTAVVAGVIWLLFSVPVIVGMALIRHFTARHAEELRRVKALRRYCYACFTFAIVTFVVGFLLWKELLYNLPIIACVSCLVGTVSLILAGTVGLNALLSNLTSSRLEKGLRDNPMEVNAG